ncbi:hypothetical protein PTSG_02680 [Salpingoeca rosetta]|uniref:Uncharacterized protein n=1 Tax=Salpingoeca rosetta (strain ATCC 50818 / BSB-021) TaxID=946362 RepID=F2U2Z9_SALR5|nr:uncharacterized protein PTSG_02680 [Salpingoeca rosetta]EGD81993.1 hypothetical protein PTSG_02680 [Salpingoeca rosetta]|eukprot:XP_004996176.1 hypothetical protein PTSG_02680 [Salpingoeca rosetta]
MPLPIRTTGIRTKFAVKSKHGDVFVNSFIAKDGVNEVGKVEEGRSTTPETRPGERANEKVNAAAQGATNGRQGPAQVLKLSLNRDPALRGICYATVQQQQQGATVAVPCRCGSATRHGRVHLTAPLYSLYSSSWATPRASDTPLQQIMPASPAFCLVLLVLLLVTFLFNTGAQEHSEDPNNASIYIDEAGHMVFEDSEGQVSLKDLLQALGTLQQSVSTLQNDNAGLRNQNSQLEARLMTVEEQQQQQQQPEPCIAFTAKTAMTTPGTFNVSLSFTQGTNLPRNVSLYIEVGGGGGAGASAGCSTYNQAGASTSLVQPSAATTWLSATGGDAGKYTAAFGVGHGYGDEGPIRMVGRGGDGGGGSSYMDYTSHNGGNGGYAAGVFQVDSAWSRISRLLLE